MHPQRNVISEALSIFNENTSHEKIIHRNYRKTVAAAGVRGIRDLDDLEPNAKKESYQKYVRHAKEFEHEPISQEEYFKGLARNFA